MGNKNYEEQIKNLLAQMTLTEKVGQLQQCGPSLVGAFDVSFEELLNMMFDGKISEEEFGKLMSTAEQDFHEEDLRAGKIGSYNGVSGAETVNRLQKIAVEETRLGIPLLFGCDVIHGHKAVTPIPLAESCAWEPALWERTGRMAAEEATACGITMTFAPMVDVAKDARWGRVSEGAGEDAMLAADYGVAKVKGYQGTDLTSEDTMVACVKHFAGYGAAEAGRDYNRVDMSMQRLYEEYLPGYEACIKAGARAIMPAFNDINGVPCSVNRWLLGDVLRGDWGFDGMTVSDANAIAECAVHGIAADKRDAARQAIEAGMDIDMSSNSYHDNLEQLVADGIVKEEVLDRAVADVLRVKFELGLFEHPYRTMEAREKETVLKPSYRELAREAAGKSIVLLKNDKNILPLSRQAKIAVAGELAVSRADMLGAWAVSADGQQCVSLEDGLAQCGASYVMLPADCDYRKETADCDIILAAIGEKKDESGEAASRASIDIHPEHRAMVEALLATGKPVVAVLYNGRPLALGDLAEKLDTIVEAWHPGVEAGNALCDILFGEVNPSAKLTTTFPYASGQCPMYYAHINTGRPGGRAKFTSKYLDTPLTPVFPFGYGLSYTKYEYTGLIVEKEAGYTRVCAKVTNTGTRAGDEIAQCYVRDLVAQRVRPVKQLAAYDKIHLNPGESKTVEFHVPDKKLGYYDNRMQFITEDGAFTFFVGANSIDCLEETVEITF